MKRNILHVIAGGDTGGAKTHLLLLVKKLQEKANVKIVCLIPGEFYKEALSLGYNVVLLEQKTRLNIGVANQLVKLINDEHFDILHCHGARANFVALFAKNKIKIPCVTTVHSDFNKDFVNSFVKNLIFTPLNKLALKKFDYYIAVSSELKTLLINHGASKDRIFLLNNGVDFSNVPSDFSRKDFCKKYSLNCSIEDKWVGIIARLNVVKGHKVFVDAAKEVLKTNPNTTFLIAGDGQEKDSVIEHIKKSGLEDKVIYMGFCKDSYELLNLLDINVLASFTEGLPYVLLESAASKKVMVSTDVGAIPDLIKHNESGLLFKPGDYNGLAENLRLLLNDDNLRKAMGEKLYEIGKESYSLEAMTNAQLGIYETILKN